jgi:PAS domain S-box-containing protein
MNLDSGQQFFPYKTFTIKSTLLIVDDRPENLLALEAVLKKDYHLIYATSGQEALDLLQKNEVDVILLDIQMPEMDGYEVARRVKQMPQCLNIPIIFITAIFTEDPHVKKGYEAGAVDYFTKPFDPDILKLKVGIYASFRQKYALLKERERQIKQSEELLKAGQKLSAILESLPVGVIIANVKGLIIQTNDIVFKICKLADPGKNDLYGQFLEWWTHDGLFFKEKFFTVIKSGIPTHNEIIKIKCFDGTYKTVLSSISPLNGLDEQMVGVVAVIQDISEHQEVKKDIEQRIIQLVSLGVEFQQMVPD